MVVHSEDGLDEISISAPTRVAELKHGEIREFTIAPEHLGFQRQPLAALRVNSPQESLAIIRGVLANRPGPALDIVALNAGAAIYVAGLADGLNEGVRMAQAVIADHSAERVLENLVAYTSQG